MENKKNKYMTGGIIAASVLIAAIIISVLVPQVTLANQQALDLYNKSNEAIERYSDGNGGYYVTITDDSRLYIKQALDASNSFLVKRSLKSQINKLNYQIIHYTALDEAMNHATQNDFRTAEEKLRFAERLDEIKNSMQFEETENSITECYRGYVQKQVDNANYERIYNELDKLMTENGIGKTWSGSYSDDICGICGTIYYTPDDITYSSYSGFGEVRLTISPPYSIGYDFYYYSYYDNQEEFQKNLDKLYNGLEIAAIVDGNNVMRYRIFNNRLTAEDIGLTYDYYTYVEQGFPSPKKVSFSDIVSTPTPAPVIPTPAPQGDEAEFVSMARNALRIPANLNVTYKLEDEYYWDVGDCYLRSISFYYNGEEIAGGTFDSRSYEMVRDIYTYSS